MATNKIYVAPGTTITFRGTSGDVDWSPASTAVGHGRLSDVWDRGDGAKPARYLWRLSTRWAATPTAGDQVRAYLINSGAAADATVTDGTFTLGDADFAGQDEIQYNCQFIGAVVAATATDKLFVSSGICSIYNRYLAVAVYNSSATKALTATESDHILTLTELPDDIQPAL